MSTTIRTAVISTLALFALLIAPSARADGFDITGHTNTEACNSFGGPSSCANVSFALVAQTEPYYSWFLVTSLTGEVNGQTITAPSPDGLLGNAGVGNNSHSGPIPFAPGVPDYLLPPGGVTVYLTIGGQTYSFGFDDELTGSVFLGGGDGTYSSLVTWDAVPISTVPEPSTLTLLGAGIMALGALGTAKRFGGL